MYILVVTGGREYRDTAAVYRALNAVAAAQGGALTLYHGGCTGADAIAAQWARYYGVTAKCWPAAWRAHGRAAGPIRNRQMIAAALANGTACALLAFPGGRGTASAVNAAQSLGVPIIWGEP